MSARREKDFFFPEKRKYHDNTEEKKQAFKKSYHDKTESIRQYRKEKCLENRTPKITYQKAKYQENSEVQLAYKKCKYLENPENIKKNNNKKDRYQKFQEKKKNCDKVENFLQQVK